jgi:hypothetical protein
MNSKLILYAFALTQLTGCVTNDGSKQGGAITPQPPAFPEPTKMLIASPCDAYIIAASERRRRRTVCNSNPQSSDCLQATAVNLESAIKDLPLAKICSDRLRDEVNQPVLVP